jgi:hypothetical protein
MHDALFLVESTVLESDGPFLLIQTNRWEP